MKKIVLTGGGTAGHVTPNIALMDGLMEKGFSISYIGSYNGIERELIAGCGVEYYPISSGKLRRYFDIKNFTDPFRVVKGYAQARRLLKMLKANIIFSKGGFVSVPVVLAAKSLSIPVIIHESDMTPGLANRIAMKGATKICCNFPETLSYLPKDKAVLTGSPIRRELLSGSEEAALSFLGFSKGKPIILVMGGSIGSVFINNAVRGSLDELLKSFRIVHLCGKGNLDPAFDDRTGYRQFEYISKELPDLFAAASLVISRAGANSICELLALRKPNILIPLSRNASRGDQILNARSFEKQGFSYVMEEETVEAATLTKAVSKVYMEREGYIACMEKSRTADSVSTIIQLICDEAK